MAVVPVATLGGLPLGGTRFTLRRTIPAILGEIEVGPVVVTPIVIVPFVAKRVAVGGLAPGRTSARGVAATVAASTATTTAAPTTAPAAARLAVGPFAFAAFALAFARFLADESLAGLRFVAPVSFTRRRRPSPGEGVVGLGVAGVGPRAILRGASAVGPGTAATTVAAAGGLATVVVRPCRFVTPTRLAVGAARGLLVTAIAPLPAAVRGPLVAAAALVTAPRVVATPTRLARPVPRRLP